MIVRLGEATIEKACARGSGASKAKTDSNKKNSIGPVDILAMDLTGTRTVGVAMVVVTYVDNHDDVELFGFVRT